MERSGCSRSPKYAPLSPVSQHPSSDVDKLCPDDIMCSLKSASGSRADREAVHPALPAPESKRGKKIPQPEGVGNRHHLPGWVIDEFRKAHDGSLFGAQTQAGGGVAIGEILEERLRIDRASALPIKH